MHKLLLSTFLLLFFCKFATAQNLSMQNQTDESYILDRFEIQSGNFLHGFNLTTKHVGSKDMYLFLDTLDKQWSKVDNENKKSLLQKSHEWADEDASILQSKKPIAKAIYKTPNNMVEYLNKKIFFAVNPIIYYQQMKENISNENLFVNTRGFEIKGFLNKKVTFYTQVTDNQERGPSYVRNLIASTEVVPGAGYIKPFKVDGNDYTLAKGYINFEAMKDHIDFTFGHDKNFIGDGYRSLFLSDYGNNNLFLKMNVKFWKIHYQSLFTELYPTRHYGADNLLPRKYAAMHHLSINVKPWWNVGAFEAVIFARKDHFDFQYLNPVIFYRTIEQMNGSPDNALLGFDSKMIPVKNIELYGQLLFDEFIFAKLKENKQYFANKYALQLGLKYINVANIKNLDLQLERNYIRPFTYSYHDSIADYTSYNQPLAHPNGANLIENIAILRYQPISKIILSSEFILRNQGMDTSTMLSNGGNVLKSNALIDRDNGYNTTGGTLVSTTYLNLNASYQWKPNIYVDAGILYRNATSSYSAFVNKSSNFYIGFRMNTNRRLYNF